MENQQQIDEIKQVEPQLKHVKIVERGSRPHYAGVRYLQ